MSTARDLFLAADWPAPPGVVAGTTLRAGGASRGVYDSLNLGAHVGDRPAAVAANRRLLLDALALPSEPRWLQQVHGVVVVDATDVLDSPPEADGSYTTAAGVVLAILTADCLPVLLSSTDGRKIAAVHAGWRGLCDGVIEQAVARLSAPADSLQAWLGPAISQLNFEVGGEVRDAFLAADDGAGAHFVSNPRGRWQADLYGLARQRLAAAGVRAVYGEPRCTFDDEARLFSYRRDGQCGRMASLIYRHAVPRS